MTDTQATPVRTAETKAATPGRDSHIKMTARDVNVFYGATHAIRDVSIDVDMENVTAFIGPSG